MVNLLWDKVKAIGSPWVTDCLTPKPVGPDKNEYLTQWTLFLSTKRPHAWKINTTVTEQKNWIVIKMSSLNWPVRLLSFLNLITAFVSVASGNVGLPKLKDCNTTVKYRGLLKRSWWNVNTKFMSEAKVNSPLQNIGRIHFIFQIPKKLFH